MARGGRIGIDIQYGEFVQNVQAAIARVDRGTKRATLAACEEIKQMTLDEVPVAYGGLADSFYYEISGRSGNFVAELGYGGNGDPVNPRTGQRASDYMVAVHEDLTADHPIGKAKYLEDPVRRYQAKFLPGVAAALRAELGG